MRNVLRHDEIQIAVESKGFYKSLNKTVALTPKLLIVSLIFWVGIYPETAGSLLMETQLLSTKLFGGWYIYATAFFKVSEETVIEANKSQSSVMNG